MMFGDLEARLLAAVRERVRNGEQTERGFARLAGISQAHFHKALKGSRFLSTEYFDLVLAALKKSVPDLFTEAELRGYVSRRGSADAPEAELPFLASPVGPGHAWTSAVSWEERHLAPCSLLEESESLVLVRLVTDPGMTFSARGFNIAALDLANDGGSTDSIYAVERDGDVVLRRVRRGRDILYLAQDDTLGDPLIWERFHPLLPNGEPRIRGRVLWLGRERTRSSGIGGSKPRPVASLQEPPSDGSLWSRLGNTG